MGLVNEAPDAVEHESEPAHCEVPDVGGVGSARAQDKGHRPGSWRRLREQDTVLRGRGDHRLLRDEDWEPCEVGGDAQRELHSHHPRARPHPGGGAVRDEGRHDHRLEVGGVGRHGRVPVHSLHRGAYDPSRADVRRAVRHTQRPGRRVRRVHERYAGGRLPRRGAPGGDVPAREDGRPAGGRARHGPCGCAAEEPDPGLRERARRLDRALLRQRGLREGARHGAGRHCLPGPAPRAGRGPEPGPPHRHRGFDLRRDLRPRPLAGCRGCRLRRRAVGERDYPFPSHGQGERDDRHVPPRPGRGDYLRPDRLPRAGGGRGRHRGRPRRH